MHRIDSRYTVPELPEPGEAVAAPGYFQNGDEESETAGTRLDAAWCNAVQEELAGVVERAGLVLDKAKRNQVAQGILLLIGGSPEIQSAVAAGQAAAVEAGQAKEMSIQHAGRQDNPHNISLTQLGTYSSAQIEAMLAALDAGQIISGTIDVDRLPKTAICELVTVADDAARFALTIEEIQLGDHVRVEDTGSLYFVKDDTQLDSENGYEPYSASVDWASITGKPTSYNPSSHTHAVGQITGVLPISQGGTGATTAAEARVALGIGTGGFFVGYIGLLPNRVGELPTGFYFTNGDRVLLSSTQGLALSGLSANFKSDWGITVSGSYISLPNLFYSDGRGLFLRAVNGSARQVGKVELDALQNITGTFYHKYNSSNIYFGNQSVTSGAFGAQSVGTGYLCSNSSSSYAGYQLVFDASGSARTDSETRPLNIGLTPIIYLGV